MNEALINTSFSVKDGGQSRKILIVTSCTKDKLFPSHLPDNCYLQASQLWDERDDNRVERNFGTLEQYRMPAVQLYRGLQHRELMRGVTLLRKEFGAKSVDIKIISAGFGLVGEQQPLPLYEATFADLPPSKILAIAQRLRIPQKINELLTKTSYDCAFFLLGENYLVSLGIPFAPEPTFPCFFVASPANYKRIPKRGMYHLIPVGKDDSVAFSYNLVGLKGHLFTLFAEQLITPTPQTPPTVLRQDISAHERLECFFATPTPEHFLSIINPFRRSPVLPDAQPTTQILQLPLFVSTQPLQKYELCEHYTLLSRCFLN